MNRSTIALLAFSAAALAAPPADIPRSSTVDLLRRSGRAVELFWNQFSSVNCTESVHQVKLNKEGKPAYRQDAAFDYLVLLRASEDSLAVEESRVKVRSNAKEKNRPPLLVTNGFSTLQLIFHPYFQSAFEYSEPEMTTQDGRRVMRVRFRHLHGARTPSCLRLRGRNYPLEWNGAALLDPRTGAVLEITASLETNMDDLGLRALTADVRYTPVRFSDTDEVFWLPSVATIDAETLEQRWRNIHQFTNYKHFSVETKSKTEPAHQ